MTPAPTNVSPSSSRPTSGRRRSTSCYARSRSSENDPFEVRRRRRRVGRGHARSRRAWRKRCERCAMCGSRTRGFERPGAQPGRPPRRPGELPHLPRRRLRSAHRLRPSILRAALPGWFVASKRLAPREVADSAGARDERPSARSRRLVVRAPARSSRRHVVQPARRAPSSARPRRPWRPGSANFGPRTTATATRSASGGRPRARQRVRHAAAASTTVRIVDAIDCVAAGFGAAGPGLRFGPPPVAPVPEAPGSCRAWTRSERATVEPARLRSCPRLRDRESGCGVELVERPREPVAPLRQGLERRG